MSYERWLDLMRTFGFGDNVEAYDDLVQAYAEPHRAYHTTRHIQSCLNLLDEFAFLAERAHEVELALWFHDAVYQPLLNSNELRSAELAARFLQVNGAESEIVARVNRLILATRHTEQAQTRDEALLLDIDLSILGAEADEYAEYEAGIRKEYALVPLFVYHRKRAAVLHGFMARPQIYLCEQLRSKFEQKARSNLTLAIATLNTN